jgi:hypothetical protein
VYLLETVRRNCPVTNVRLTSNEICTENVMKNQTEKESKKCENFTCLVHIWNELDDILMSAVHFLYGELSTCNKQEFV